MRVKVKNDLKQYFLVDFSSQTFTLPYSNQTEIRPVAILKAKDEKTLKIVEVTDIEEVD